MRSCSYSLVQYSFVQAITGGVVMFVRIRTSKIMKHSFVICKCFLVSLLLMLLFFFLLLLVLLLHLISHFHWLLLCCCCSFLFFYNVFVFIWHVLREEYAILSFVTLHYSLHTCVFVQLLTFQYHRVHLLSLCPFYAAVLTV